MYRTVALKGRTLDQRAQIQLPVLPFTNLNEILNLSVSLVQKTGTVVHTSCKSYHVKGKKRQENVWQNSSFHQLSMDSIISPVKVGYHSAFSWYEKVIKNGMEIEYIKVIYFQTPGVSILYEITLTLFPFLDFLIKCYPSHLAEKTVMFITIILLCKYSA